MPTTRARKQKRSNKYGAIKETVDGIVFDSRLEARRYGQLKLLERAGTIRGLRVHPVYPIIIDGEPVKMRNGHAAKYTADFSYFEGNESVTEDCKGFVVRDWPLRRAIIEAIYKITIREINRA